MTNPYYTRTGEPVDHSQLLSQRVRNEFALVESAFDGINSSVDDLAALVDAGSVGITPKATSAVTANYTTAATDDHRVLQITSSVVSPLTVYLKDAQDVLGQLGYTVTISNMSAIAHTISRENLTNTINGSAANITIAPLTSITFVANTQGNGYLISAFGAGMNGADGTPVTGWSLTGSGVSRTVDIKLQESFVSITDMGAVAGVDSTAAIQAVINLAKTYGRTIKVPAGGAFQYTSLNLDDIDNGLRFMGEGNPYNANTGNCSELRCIATGTGVGISIDSSFGVTFEDLWLSYSSASYTGILIQTDHSARLFDTSNLNILRCKLSGLTTAIDGATTLLEFRNTIISSVKGCFFAHATDAIRFASTYNTTIEILNKNVFVNLNGDAIVFANGCSCDSIGIIGNVFEPRQDGTPCPINSLATALAASNRGLKISGNWFGDSTAGRSWVTLCYGRGTEISTNVFGDVSPQYAVSLIENVGTEVKNNFFWNLAIDIACTSPAPGMAIHGNVMGLGDTAVRWTGTQPLVYQNGGMTDQYTDLRLKGGVNQSLVFQPKSGTTAAQIWQAGDTLYFGKEGGANYASLNISSGRFFPPNPAPTSQAACALWAGFGAPSDAQGSDGDVYLRSDGGAGTTMYHKAGGVWTARA